MNKSVFDKSDYIDLSKSEWRGKERSRDQVTEDLIILNLRGFSVREIEKITGMSKSTVHYRLTKSKTLLERMILDEKSFNRIVYTAVTLKTLFMTAFRQIYRTKDGSKQRYLASKTAAKLHMKLYELYVKTGCIKVIEDPYKSFSKYVNKLSMSELLSLLEHKENLIAQRRKVLRNGEARVA